MSSGWAIAGQAQTLAKQEPDSLLAKMVNGKADELTARHVGQAVEQGDGLAKWLMDESLEHLARAICHVVALLCPRRIVIGGGVSLMGERVLFAPLRKLVAARVFKPFAGCYEIVPAILGEEMVVHGALALARKRLTPPA